MLEKKWGVGSSSLSSLLPTLQMARPLQLACSVVGLLMDHVRFAA